MPTLFVGREEVLPLTAVVYYVNRSAERISAPPKGLVMLAGTSLATSRQPKGIVSWSCGEVGGRPRHATIPACREDSMLQLQATFPNSWDGRRLDSPDHRQHVKYASCGVASGGAADDRPHRALPTGPARIAGRLREVRRPRGLHERLGSDGARAPRQGAEPAQIPARGTWTATR